MATTTSALHRVRSAEVTEGLLAEVASEDTPQKLTPGVDVEVREGENVEVQPGFETLDDKFQLFSLSLSSSHSYSVKSQKEQTLNPSH